jgi:hypothetical protein
MTKTTETTHHVPIGAVFCWSWGYDQTNVDYYQVVGLTRCGVRVRPIAAERVPGSGGQMSCRVRPARDHFISEKVETKRVGRTNRGDYYLAKPYGWCDLVKDGETEYCSWYA